MMKIMSIKHYKEEREITNTVRKTKLCTKEQTSSEEEKPAWNKQVSVSRTASINSCFRLAPRGPLI